MSKIKCVTYINNYSASRLMPEVIIEVDYSEKPFEYLRGKTINKIEHFIPERNEHLVFYLSNGEVFSMHHEQDCCERVFLEDVAGDLLNLLNTPILQADEEISGQSSDGYSDSETWSFYRLATVKGYATLRWYGTSNGYYSETVGLYPVKKIYNHKTKEVYYEERT